VVAGVLVAGRVATARVAAASKRRVSELDADRAGRRG
jgi:hypothetical protein